MYSAFITRIKNLRKHTNADRLMCGECFGNTVIVGLDTQPDELGIYFPVDGKIGVEYAQKNDLVRRKDASGNTAGGYLDPEKRNIKALKLRGEKSDGLFMPLSSLADFTDISKLKEGDTITVLNGITICEKYIPRSNRSGSSGGGGNRTRKHKDPVSPLFQEHADTEQLAYNLQNFRPNDLVEITLKMHGTSQRTGYLPTLKGYKRTLLDRILKRPGTPIYDWGYVTGTRRVVLEDYDGGYYGSNAFREQHTKVFEGKLHKGETVYYEVVGFTQDGAPIMASCDNKKVGDKAFTKQYGATTTFSYGCSPTGKKTLHGNDDMGAFQIEADCPQSDLYVYRMTMTNEDGDVVEYSPDFMRYRCEQMGVKTVPVFWGGGTFLHLPSYPMMLAVSPRLMLANGLSVLLSSSMMVQILWASPMFVRVWLSELSIAPSSLHTSIRILRSRCWRASSRIPLPHRIWKKLRLKKPLLNKYFFKEKERYEETHLWTAVDRYDAVSGWLWQHFFLRHICGYGSDSGCSK